MGELPGDTGSSQPHRAGGGSSSSGFKHRRPRRRLPHPPHPQGAGQDHDRNGAIKNARTKGEATASSFKYLHLPRWELQVLGNEG